MDDENKLKQLLDSWFSMAKIEHLKGKQFSQRLDKIQSEIIELKKKIKNETRNSRRRSKLSGNCSQDQ